MEQFRHELVLIWDAITIGKSLVNYIMVPVPWSNFSLSQIQCHEIKRVWKEVEQGALIWAWFPLWFLAVEQVSIPTLMTMFVWLFFYEAQNTKSYENLPLPLFFINALIILLGLWTKAHTSRIGKVRGLVHIGGTNVPLYMRQTFTNLRILFRSK